MLRLAPFHDPPAETNRLVGATAENARLRIRASATTINVFPATASALTMSAAPTLDPTLTPPVALAFRFWKIRPSMYMLAGRRPKPTDEVPLAMTPAAVTPQLPPPRCAIILSPDGSRSVRTTKSACVGRTGQSSTGQSSRPTGGSSAMRGKVRQLADPEGRSNGR
jgi:hypothetical protein